MRCEGTDTSTIERTILLEPVTWLRAIREKELIENEWVARDGEELSQCATQPAAIAVVFHAFL